MRCTRSIESVSYTSFDGKDTEHVTMEELVVESLHQELEG